MAAIGEKDIKALIRNGDIGGAFLFFGTESYLKEFYSSKLKDKEYGNGTCKPCKRHFETY